MTEPITPEALVELRLVVEQYHAIMPDIVQDAANAGASQDCALAVSRLLPYLREAGAERVEILCAVALVRLAQSWQHEGVAL